MTTRIALLFPGQGAQFVGMGRELREESPAARAVFDRAAALFGGSFVDTLFNGPEEDLKRTEITQPAIYTVSVAAWSALAESRPDLEVAATGGLSLGEYSALTAAGVLPFEEGLELVRQRSLFMQEAGERNPGAMAAVLQLEPGTVQEICARHEKVYVANYNCPGQIVITGSPEGVKAAGEELMAAGARRVLPLQVSGAFHSPFMEPARERLLPLLQKVAWQKPACPVASNVLGDFYPADADFAALLGRQIVEVVRWEEDCRAMLAAGIGLFAEAGPGNVLQGLMRKISKEVRCLPAGTPGEVAGI